MEFSRDSKNKTKKLEFFATPCLNMFTNVHVERVNVKTRLFIKLPADLSGIILILIIEGIFKFLHIFSDCTRFDHGKKFELYIDYRIHGKKLHYVCKLEHIFQH